MKQIGRHVCEPLPLVLDRAKIHRGLNIATFLYVMGWRQFYLPPYARLFHLVAFAARTIRSLCLADYVYVEGAPALFHFAV
jgi:hypothetical protein